MRKILLWACLSACSVLVLTGCQGENEKNNDRIEKQVLAATKYLNMPVTKAVAEAETEGWVFEQDENMWEGTLTIDSLNCWLLLEVNNDTVYNISMDVETSTAALSCQYFNHLLEMAGTTIQLPRLGQEATFAEGYFELTNGRDYEYTNFDKFCEALQGRPAESIEAADAYYEIGKTSEDCGIEIWTESYDDNDDGITDHWFGLFIYDFGEIPFPDMAPRRKLHK